MHGRCCDYGVYANELSALCKANSYDVVCIAETWLDSEISGSEVNISGYRVFRHDRNHHGGRVLIYVKTYACS